MDRGSYIAASGGLLQMRKLEVQNNNLANLDTVGFKRQFLTAETQSFESTFASLMPKNEAPFAELDHEQMAGVENIQTRTDFSVGPIRNTGNPLDVALKNPNDFFVVSTPEGPMYTRAGNFTLNGNGDLVTQDGSAVQGEGGPINVGAPGATITGDGSVRVNRQPVGRLQVVRFTDPSGLERVGGSRFKLGAGQAQPATVDPALETQAVEMSNASAISSMVDMIVINRAFEAYTKAAQTIDGMNQTAIQQVGKRQ